MDNAISSQLVAIIEEFILQMGGPTSPVLPDAEHPDQNSRSVLHDTILECRNPDVEQSHESPGLSADNTNFFCPDEDSSTLSAIFDYEERQMTPEFVNELQPKEQETETCQKEETFVFNSGAPHIFSTNEERNDFRYATSGSSVAPTLRLAVENEDSYVTRLLLPPNVEQIEGSTPQKEISPQNTCSVIQHTRDSELFANRKPQEKVGRKKHINDRSHITASTIHSHTLSEHTTTPPLNSTAKTRGRPTKRNRANSDVSQELVTRRRSSCSGDTTKTKSQTQRGKRKKDGDKCAVPYSSPSISSSDVSVPYHTNSPADSSNIDQNNRASPRYARPMHMAMVESRMNSPSRDKIPDLVEKDSLNITPNCSLNHSHSQISPQLTNCNPCERPVSVRDFSNQQSTSELWLVGNDQYVVGLKPLTKKVLFLQPPKSKIYSRPSIFENSKSISPPTLSDPPQAHASTNTPKCYTPSINFDFLTNIPPAHQNTYHSTVTDKYIYPTYEDSLTGHQTQLLRSPDRQNYQLNDIIIPQAETDHVYSNNMTNQSVENTSSTGAHGEDYQQTIHIPPTNSPSIRSRSSATEISQVQFQGNDVSKFHSRPSSTPGNADSELLFSSHARNGFADLHSHENSPLFPNFRNVPIQHTDNYTIGDPHCNSLVPQTSTRTYDINSFAHLPLLSEQTKTSQTNECNSFQYMERNRLQNSIPLMSSNQVSIKSLLLSQNNPQTLLQPELCRSSSNDTRPNGFTLPQTDRTINKAQNNIENLTSKNYNYLQPPSSQSKQTSSDRPFQNQFTHTASKPHDLKMSIRHATQLPSHSNLTQETAQHNAPRPHFRTNHVHSTTNDSCPEQSRQHGSLQDHHSSDKINNSNSSSITKPNNFNNSQSRKTQRLPITYGSQNNANGLQGSIISQHKLHESSLPLPRPLSFQPNVRDTANDRNSYSQHRLSCTPGHGRGNYASSTIIPSCQFSYNGHFTANQRASSGSRLFDHIPGPPPPAPPPPPPPPPPLPEQPLDILSNRNFWQQFLPGPQAVQTFTNPQHNIPKNERTNKKQ